MFSLALLLKHALTACEVLKFNEEVKGVFSLMEKLNCFRMGKPPESLKALLAEYIAESKHFLFNI